MLLGYIKASFSTFWISQWLIILLSNIPSFGQIQAALHVLVTENNIQQQYWDYKYY